MNKSITAESVRKNKIKSFDPNQPGSSSEVFGLPFDEFESQIILLPVPWEATVSYGKGTSLGPKAILDASLQVDLFHPEFNDLWKVGIYMRKISTQIKSKSSAAKKLAQSVIDVITSGKNTKHHLAQIQKVNEASSSMISWVKSSTEELLQQGKLVGLIGGDHSTPLGYLQTLSSHYKEFGILQIDAHMDLRKAYEGFTYSHASIMYNALQIPNIKQLVQVGIRDYCEEEVEFYTKNKKRIGLFTYAEIQKQQFEGKSWQQIVKQIIDQLPKNVYISFDIDGLDPKLCPNTGTPVPGGFEFHQITYLLSELNRSGKRIIGFDLNEVAPGTDDWDGNVGARMLFHLCGVIAKSNRLI